MFAIKNKAAARRNKVGGWVFAIKVKVEAGRDMVGRATPCFKSTACKGAAF